MISFKGFLLERAGLFAFEAGIQYSNSVATNGQIWQYHSNRKQWYSRHMNYSTSVLTSETVCFRNVYNRYVSPWTRFNFQFMVYIIPALINIFNIAGTVFKSTHISNRYTIVDFVSSTHRQSHYSHLICQCIRDSKSKVYRLSHYCLWTFNWTSPR